MSLHQLDYQSVPVESLSAESAGGPMGWGLLPVQAESETRARRLLFWVCAAIFTFLFAWAAWQFNVPAHNGIDQNGYLVGGRMIAETGTMKIAPRRLDNPQQVDPHQFVGGMWVGAECGTDRERFYPKYPIGLPLLFAGAIRLADVSLGHWTSLAVPGAIGLSAILAGAWIMLFACRRWGIEVQLWTRRVARVGTIVAIVLLGVLGAMLIIRACAQRFVELGYQPGPTLAFWVSPLCAVASVVATYMLLRLVCSSYLAFLGTAVYATSPVSLLLMTNPNSHASTVCCVAWGMYFLIAFWRFEGIWRAFLAGLFLGYAATIRYTEATLLLPLTLVAVYYLRLGRRSWWLVSLEWWRRRFRVQGSGFSQESTSGPGWWSAWGRQWTGAITLLIGWAIPAGFLAIYNLRAMGTLTGYDPTNEGRLAAFTWDFARDNWETMLRHMNTNGVFMFFGIGLVGMIWMFWVNWRLASVLTSWIVPCLVIYTFYYWAPDNQQNNMAIHTGYLRFFLTIIPGVVLCGMWLLGRLAKLTEGNAEPAWYQRWPRALEMAVVLLPLAAALSLLWFKQWYIAAGVVAASVVWLIALLARLGEGVNGARRSVIRWQRILELLIAALPAVVGLIIALAVDHRKFAWVMVPPLVVCGVWVMEWLGEQGNFLGMARRWLLREAGLWTVPLAVAVSAALVLELKFDDWSVIWLIGLGACAGLAVSVPIFSRRLPVSVCAGILAALAVAVHMENATDGLESDHYARLNLAQNTQQVLEATKSAPRGSVIFCADKSLLHNLQFERDFIVYTNETFNAGANKALGNKIDFQKVQYYDPARTKAMFERLKDFDQRQLEEQQRQIVAGALAAGRKVFVLDRAARQRDANSPVKPQTLAQKWSAASGPNITPLFHDLRSFWRFSNVPKAADDETLVKRREGNRRGRPGPRGDGGGPLWWVFEVARQPLDPSPWALVLVEREMQVKEETDRRLAAKTEQEKRDRERRLADEQAQRERAEAVRKQREEADRLLRDQAARQKAELADLLKQTRTAQADAQAAADALNKAKQDQKNVEDVLKKLNADTTAAQQLTAKAAADRQAAEAALNKATAAATAAQQAKADADQSLATAQAALAKSEADKTALEQSLAQLRAEQAVLQKAIEQARAEKAAADKEAAAARTKIPVPPATQPATRAIAGP